MHISPQHDFPRAAFLPCRLCQRGHEHPAHVFFECTAGRLPELRVQLLADAPAAWGRLLSRVEEAVLQEYSDSIPEMPGARLALETAFAAADNREAHWLTHRLLWAMPWPASVVPADAAAARAIGGIFDQTVLSRHASRPLADTWIAWASRWTQTFGACYAELLRACADVPDGVASPRPSPSHSSSPAPANAARGLDSSSPLTDPFLPSSQSSEA